MKRKLKEILLKVKPIKNYVKGRSSFNDAQFLKVQKRNYSELSKKPSRTEVLNFLLSLKSDDTFYLEIGVRNPIYNFNYIKATKKYSVDPGLEYDQNPVDFKITSDEFFRKLRNGEILSSEIKFDVIFIDGLHLAEQVDRDIINSLNHVKDDGFIVLHDCNPPSEWHAREYHKYWFTPAQGLWNGTTWKAFFKWRCNPLVNSCCIEC
ncbi:class I SAM-dependent methyltransferase [Salinimicrobium terrae]|uniref:class I SAM-dependent methyltransferase n=1 Tax=Salinimicrobium terrae TaxID=470866 RepID=UPI001B7FE7CB|nr:class I SAM-dependent methyltransferase [Salinimicrobium terrae]